MDWIAGNSLYKSSTSWITQQLITLRSLSTQEWGYRCVVCLWATDDAFTECSYNCAIRDELQWRLHVSHERLDVFGKITFMQFMTFFFNVAVVSFVFNRLKLYTVYIFH
jgi:hypothetical protein